MMWLVPCLLLLAFAASSESVEGIDSAANRTAMSDALLAGQNISGFGAVWTANGELLYQRAFGFFDYRFQVEMEIGKRYPIASNTKLYVAVALYQLQEQGKVNLSHSIGDYLNASDFLAFGLPNISTYCPVALTTPPGECEVITFEQLLGMSAGIANTAWYIEFVPFLGSIGALAGQYITQPLAFVPGTQYLYSNPSFVIAAYFVQKLSGLSLNQYLQQNILGPLGLHDTYYDQGDQQFFMDPLRVSEFHRFLDPQNKELISVGRCVELNLGSINGAGGMVSTAEDAKAWYFKLFNFTGALGAEILTPWSVMEIVKPRIAIPGDWQDAYYGQGIAVIAPKGANTTVPEQILYEGGLECVHTANYLDLTVEPHRLTQVWTNSPVHFATQEQLTSASQAESGSWWSLVAAWPTGESLIPLSVQLSSLWS